MPERSVDSMTPWFRQLAWNVRNGVYKVGIGHRHREILCQRLNAYSPSYGLGSPRGIHRGSPSKCKQLGLGRPKVRQLPIFELREQLPLLLLELFHCEVACFLKRCKLR